MRMNQGWIVGSALLASYVVSDFAYAGEKGFFPAVSARVQAVITGGSTLDSDIKFDAATAPALALVGLPQIDGATHFGATSIEFDRFDNTAAVIGDGITPSSFAESAGSAADRITLTATGNPVGVTRLELTWLIDGTLAGDADYQFLSIYNRDTLDPEIEEHAGDIAFGPGDAGTISTQVTYVYDDVPLGSPWNLVTSVLADTRSPGGSLIFGDTRLSTVELFVGGQQVGVTMLGDSGQIYSLIGDANNDQKVELLDFNILAANFGLGPAAPGGAAIGDFNWDGSVDLDDFNLLAANFGLGNETVAPLPEPAALVFLTAATLTTVARRCR